MWSESRFYFSTLLFETTDQIENESCYIIKSYTYLRYGFFRVQDSNVNVENMFHSQTPDRLKKMWINEWK